MRDSDYIIIDTRKCKVCLEIKPISLFDTNRRQCKACRLIYSNAHKKKPHVLRRAALRGRERWVRDPVYKERKTALINRWRKAHPNYNSKREPSKILTVFAVRDALKAGKLEKPEACESCGAPGPVQAHHSDYSQPLQVKWICTKCHGKEHRKYE